MNNIEIKWEKERRQRKAEHDAHRSELEEKERQQFSNLLNKLGDNIEKSHQDALEKEIDKRQRKAAEEVLAEYRQKHGLIDEGIKGELSTTLKGAMKIASSFTDTYELSAVPQEDEDGKAKEE